MQKLTTLAFDPQLPCPLVRIPSSTSSISEMAVIQDISVELLYRILDLAFDQPFAPGRCAFLRRAAIVARAWKRPAQVLLASSLSLDLSSTLPKHPSIAFSLVANPRSFAPISACIKRLPTSTPVTRLALYLPYHTATRHIEGLTDLSGLVSLQLPHSSGMLHASAFEGVLPRKLHRARTTCVSELTSRTHRTSTSDVEGSGPRTPHRSTLTAPPPPP